jgi:isoquinoline 1-oxidoreductase beta subunit
VNGREIYGIDVSLPGMKFATIAASRTFSGKVGHVDEGDAKSIPGVRQIVVLDDMVAVVGDHMWAAKQGLDAEHRLESGTERARPDHAPGRRGPAQAASR